MRETSLVIMAAGIGSRFGGGIKQLEPVGPGGEIIMDYSIHDALEAGFNRIIFIIRKDLEKDFREIIGNRIEKIAPVSYAFQELSDLPEGYRLPEGRTKPWGTGQAVLCAKELVREPFLVINADDYYGKEAFRLIHDYLVNAREDRGDVYDICMAGFILSNTLSEKRDGILTASDREGNPVRVSGSQHVSMNMWGLTPDFMGALEKGFPKFLSDLKEGDLKSEYLLPTIIDQMIREGRAKVRVLETRDRWFGVTYREDRESVSREIRRLCESGVYPEHLF